MTIISFTGHRCNKLPFSYTIPNPFYISLCKEIKKHLEESKPDKCISGMCVGVDLWAANICRIMNIPFIAAIPFKGQECKWPEKSQKEYQKLLSYASEIVIISDGGYSAEKMQIRNEWMVDNSDLVIAVWDGSKDGTGNCVKYAKSKDKKIIYINPNEIRY